MFETRSEAWERAGLEVQEVDSKTVRRAQIEAIVLVPLMIAIVVAYNHQEQLVRAWPPDTRADHRRSCC